MIPYAFSCYDRDKNEQIFELLIQSLYDKVTKPMSERFKKSAVDEFISDFKLMYLELDFKIGKFFKIDKEHSLLNFEFAKIKI